MKSKISTLFILMSFLVNSYAEAATLIQIKNQKTLIDLEGHDASVDEIYDVVGATGKSGQIKIVQVKNGKAIGQIIAGSVAVGQKLRTNPNGPAAPRAVRKKDIVIRHDLMQFSILGKLMMNTITTKQKETVPIERFETVTMNGTNIGITAALDYPLSSQYTFHGQLGLEPVVVKGTAQFNSCAGQTSKDCNVSINYLAGAGYLRYDFIKSKNTIWGAIGGTVKFPISKSSTALVSGDINLANSLGLMFGYDYNFDNKTYIPATFEYHYSFNTSETVPVINQIALQLGYGWKF